MVCYAYLPYHVCRGKLCVYRLGVEETLIAKWEANLLYGCNFVSH